MDEVEPLPAVFYSEQEALYYDLYTEQTSKDVDMWCRLAQRYCADGSVLELGCGTMRVGIALCKQGYRVVGVDKSRPMLARASQKISALYGDGASRIDLIEADIKSVLLGRTFQFVCMPLSVMMEFVEEEDQILALTTAYNHLQVGGVLGFDVPFVNAQRLRAIQPDERRPYAEFCMPDKSVFVTRRFSLAADYSTNTAELTFWTEERLQEEAGQNTVASPTHLQVKYFYPDDLMFPLI